MTESLKAAIDTKGSTQDARMVQECLKGSQEAWSALVDKYKKLIFSIPVKQGFPPEDAARSTSTEPRRIPETASSVTNSGARRPGTWAVVMITSWRLAASASSPRRRSFSSSVSGRA